MRRFAIVVIQMSSRSESNSVGPSESSELERIARGDPGAVRDCLDRFGALVFSIARRMSRCPADAEDAAQEIFLDIWRSAARYDANQGSQQVFIATIARRRMIDRLRRRSAEPPTDSTEELDEIAWAESEDVVETAAEAARAVRVLAELPREQRLVMELGLLHGLSHAQIAARLSLPLGSVKSLMRRGLIKVRARIEAGEAQVDSGGER